MLNKYWNSYYSDKIIENNIPSQFAVFIGSEYAGKVFDLIEFGSGSGRDIRFLSSLANRSIAVEGSESACERLVEKSHGKYSVIESDISNPILSDKLLDALKSDLRMKRFFYSRFFIHAITEKEEDCFFELISKISTNGDCFFAEFRTEKDAKGKKLTPSHYRRYILPSNLITKLNKIGFNINYQCEGYGYAKYKDDDAYVCRLIATKK